jgi:hypothetical protein
MSKNTNISGFRKIDIDKYDPENYDDDENNQSQIEDGGPNEAEIVSFLQS